MGKFLTVLLMLLSFATYAQTQVGGDVITVVTDDGEGSVPGVPSKVVILNEVNANWKKCTKQKREAFTDLHSMYTEISLRESVRKLIALQTKSPADSTTCKTENLSRKEEKEIKCLFKGKAVGEFQYVIAHYNKQDEKGKTSYIESLGLKHDETQGFVQFMNAIISEINE